MILNDELNEEIEELKKELEGYSNELDKLYSLDNTRSQKMIKTIEELEQKIDIVEKSKNSINNELIHAINIIRKKYPEKLEIFEESKESEFKEPEEPEKYDINGFDKYGIHRFTHTKYDHKGFDKEGFDEEGFDEEGFNKEGFNKKGFNKEGFNKEGLHKYTKNKYDPNGFDKYGKHKDTNTFLNKEKYIRKDILKNINWLNDEDEFLNLYDKIIKNGEFNINTKKMIMFHRICLKNF